MSSIQIKTKEVLLHIKSNEHCNSRELDRNLVKDLYEQGFIDGDMSHECTGEARVFYNLRIKLSGEHYLNELISPSSNNWRNSKIVDLGLKVVAGVSIAIIIYVLFPN